MYHIVLLHSALEGCTKSWCIILLAETEYSIGYYGEMQYEGVFHSRKQYHMVCYRIVQESGV